MRSSLPTVTLLCALILVTGARTQQPAAVRVGTVVAERKLIARLLDFVHRVGTIQHFDIRARVTGFLQKILFKEGELVRQDALFRQRGALFRAQVKYRNVGARAQLDQQIALEKSAQGEVAVATATLQTATISPGHIKIAYQSAARSAVPT
jgi:membrane fusion protein, multidrug efflux system